MKKSTYIRGRMAGCFYNFTELLAQMIIARKPPKYVTVERRVLYGDGPRERLNLIYKKTEEKRPLFLYIHGGGWISGNVDMRDTYCTEFVKQGFFAANIDYEYAPRQIFPYQIKQCLKALDWIYEHAEEYNIDMSKILLAGESAGVYFLYYLAAIAANPGLADKLGIDFNARDKFKVTAIISNCGAIDIVRLTENKFPDIKTMLKSFTGKTIKELKNGVNNDEIRLMIPQISEKTPPSMIIYARHDKLKSESMVLKEQLDRLAVPNKTFEGTGLISQHAFPIATIEKRGKQCLKETMDFILPYFR